MNNIRDLLSKEEAARLYKIHSPELKFWAYWGVPSNRHSKLSERLYQEIYLFQDIAEYRPFRCREFNNGRIILKIPDIQKVSPRKIVMQEGEVFIGIEGNNHEVWNKAIELYRLVRRVFPSRGRGGKPGEISWRQVAEWLEDNPEEYPNFLKMLASRKAKKWAKQWGESEPEPGWTDKRQFTTEEKAAFELAQEEIKRGLSRARRKRFNLHK